MHKHLYKLVNEQFSISDLDFSDDTDNDVNIFSKDILDVDEIYDKIDNDILLQNNEITQLERCVSVYKVAHEIDLSLIVGYYCKYFNEFSLNWLDVSGIDDMSYMFNDKNYKGDISKWDVSNVKTMNRMFDSSPFNGDISKWDVSNVRDMSYMFIKSAFNNDISMWNVSNVKNMRCMFASSPFNHDISQWDVTNVKDMFSMFYNSPFNKDISKWNISGVTDMSYMFAGSSFNKDISKWDVSKISWFINIFECCPIKKQYKPEKFR